MIKRYFTDEFIDKFPEAIISDGYANQILNFTNEHEPKHGTYHKKLSESDRFQLARNQIFVTFKCFCVKSSQL